MKNLKLTGSFYTPKIIADFLVNRILSKLKGKSYLTVLEPSAGDGIFVKTIFDNKQFISKINKIVAVEKNKSELNKLTRNIKNNILSSVNDDFLKFQNENNEKFSIVIGNPPYIKKNFLESIQIDYCLQIHQNAKLANNKPKNIWTAFLVRCIEFTNDSGILAFVLPAELLQVKFASELRELILREFERVEIFTFNELLFKDCKGQDTVLLIGERKSTNKGVYYCNIDKVIDLDKNKFTLSQNIKVRESKWTHHHLETDEIELLEKLKLKLQNINNYCTSKAGIVTAANDYFIINTDTVDKYSLQNYVKPIIQKGAFVNGSIVLTIEDFQILIDKSKPTFLIAIDNNSKIDSNLIEYLEIGKTKQIHTRFKSLIRENWFQVPNIGNPPEAFFFKRCNEYPKLIKNNANVLSTDSAYIIKMNDNYHINDLIFSFYNSLTLSFAELEGRYYGGGVLELTPNEFKKLPLPYTTISRTNFNEFVLHFNNKENIRDICKKNDHKILRSVDPLIDSDSINKIFNIREKLFLRRMKLL